MAPHDERARAIVTGEPMDRVDGRLKVTGAARYSAEIPVANVAYGVIVGSTIANGRIASIDTGAAEQAVGVVRVLTHRNAPRLAAARLTLLQDDIVRYNGQPVAVVVADTLERAIDAASLVAIRYEHGPTPSTVLTARRAEAYTPTGGRPDSLRGDIAAGIAAADVTIDAHYATPFEHHNPLEPHATLALWEGDALTVYDSTQYIVGARDGLARTFGVPPEKVRVVSHFVGGGFGSKGRMWSHVPLAAMAAKVAGRPVKLALTRRQMFGPVGGRPETAQHIVLGARRDGTLTVVRHESLSNTSRFDEFVEQCAGVTRILYAVPNLETTHRLVKLDLGTPTYQRAPGHAPGVFALETAMDELAMALAMDPVALRLRNHADRDPESGREWSSKSLRECYRAGAETFGWARRSATPRSRREGSALVGHGMATATYPTNQNNASASARLVADASGAVRALVQSASHELGTGLYTVLMQVAADALGLPPSQVRVELGDSRMPPSPVSGGSMTSASTGTAVHVTCLAAKQKLIELAVADAASPLSGASADAVTAAEGRLFLTADPSRGEGYAAVLARQPERMIVARADTRPEAATHSAHSFGAVFAEVRVDPDLGEIRVARVVAAYGAGRILNAKTARSQMHGGIIWGIGMALQEKTLVDPRTGRYLNADLAEYHVPVNADVGQLDIIFVDEVDTHINPLGVKGIGEIGMTGVAAAIGNAVYNATGVRVRELPITVDKVMGAVRI